MKHTRTLLTALLRTPLAALHPTYEFSMIGNLRSTKICLVACILVSLVAFGAVANDSLSVRHNEVVEWRGQASRACADPFNEATLDALATLSDGSEIHVPGFWAGIQEWFFRFSSPVIGRFPFRTVCSDTNDAGLQDQLGVIEVTPCRGNNRLLQHGPVELSANRRYFAHAEGTPFFWLADSWCRAGRSTRIGC